MPIDRRPRPAAALAGPLALAALVGCRAPAPPPGPDAAAAVPPQTAPTNAAAVRPDPLVGPAQPVQPQVAVPSVQCTRDEDCVVLCTRRCDGLHADALPRGARLSQAQAGRIFAPPGCPPALPPPSPPARAQASAAPAARPKASAGGNDPKAARLAVRCEQGRCEADQASPTEPSCAEWDLEAAREALAGAADLDTKVAALVFLSQRHSPLPPDVADLAWKVLSEGAPALRSEVAEVLLRQPDAKGKAAARLHAIVLAGNPVPARAAPHLAALERAQAFALEVCPLLAEHLESASARQALRGFKDRARAVAPVVAAALDQRVESLDDEELADTARTLCAIDADTRAKGRSSDLLQLRCAPFSVQRGPPVFDKRLLAPLRSPERSATSELCAALFGPGSSLLGDPEDKSASCEFSAPAAAAESEALERELRLLVDPNGKGFEEGSFQQKKIDQAIDRHLKRVKCPAGAQAIYDGEVHCEKQVWKACPAGQKCPCPTGMRDAAADSAGQLEGCYRCPKGSLDLPASLAHKERWAKAGAAGPTVVCKAPAQAR